MAIFLIAPRAAVCSMAGHSGGTPLRERGKRIISLGVIIAVFTDAESKKCNCDPNNVKLHTCAYLFYIKTLTILACSMRRVYYYY
jgi:hypothetical protein